MSDEPLRAVIYAAILRHLKDTAQWSTINGEITQQCANLPEPSDEQKKQSYITALESIITYLQGKGYKPEQLAFLKDERNNAKYTSQISSFIEKDDYVDDRNCALYARASYIKQGIVNIPAVFNIKQVRKLAQYVYDQTGNLVFFITQEHELQGRITGENFESQQTLAVLRIAKGTTDATEHVKQAYLYNETIDKRKFMQIREITGEFHIYRFLATTGKEYVLLSDKRLEFGEYTISGMELDITDLKKISDTAKVNTKLPFLFVHTARGTILSIRNPEAFLCERNTLPLSGDELLDWMFTFERTKQRATVVDAETELVVALQPDWFKRFIWSWVLHASVGDAKKYPLHFCTIGAKGCGKTTLMNSVHAHTLEYNPIFSGAGSTIKKVIPSFKETPAKIGYLGECNRFAFLDEFFRCLTETHDTSARGESLGKLNDLLMHEKRQFGSGNGSTNVQMRSRAMFNNNPPRGHHNIEELLKEYDGAFLSRLLIYWQDDKDAHVKLVRNCRPADLKPFTKTVSPMQVMPFIDYCQSFVSVMDLDRIQAIFDAPLPLFSEALRNHYEARHKHHLMCVLDGIVKLRCLLDATDDFIAQLQDYDLAEEIWSNIIRSWIDGEYIRRLPLHKRAQFLPETAQWLWRQILGEHDVLDNKEMERIALLGLEKHEFYTAYTILKSNGLIVDLDGVTTPYFQNPLYEKELEVTT